MKKYWDVDHEKLWTEDELRKEYDNLKANGELEEYYETFEYYLNACLDKNGSLVLVAPDSEIEKLRKNTAMEIAAQSDMKYEDILNVLQKYNVHGTWTMWEINHRPRDIDELQEMVEQELGWR